jgi:ESCRT-II complex subunit VPS36
MGLPLRVRKFASGVIVVQGSQFSDEQLCRNIEQLLQTKMQQQQQQQQIPGSTALSDHLPASSASAAAAAGVPLLGPPLVATDVSAALSLPLTLAREALLVAESRGVVCRDDGPEGLRFFRNFFAEAQPVAV